MSLSIKASYAGVGAGASAYANFSSHSNSDQSKTYILATVTVDSGGTEIAPVNDDDPNKNFGLTAYAQHLLRIDPSGNAFYRTCGDGYIISSRNGGRLDALFQQYSSILENDKQSSLGISAHGYGASGSVSLNTAETTELYSGKLDYEVVQLGGIQGGAATPSDLAKKVLNFSTAESRFWGKFEISVVPYRGINGWKEPTALRITPTQMRSYFDLLKRVQTLWAVYDSASASPSDYYRPFATDSDLDRQTLTLHFASNSLEQMLISCDDAQSCRPEVLWAKYGQSNKSNLGDLTVDVASVNPGTNLISLSSAIPPSAGADYGVLLSTPTQNIVAPGFAAAPQLALSEQQLFAALALSGMSTTRADLAATAVISNLTHNRANLAEHAMPTAVAYYQFLATEPMKRVVNPQVPGTPVSNSGDLLIAVRSYCSRVHAQQFCDAALSSVILSSGDSTKQADAREVFREYILNERLLPLQEASCSVSQSDLMCISVGDLNDLLNRTPLKFGTGAGFDKPPPAPSPPPRHPHFRNPPFYPFPPLPW